MTTLNLIIKRKYFDQILKGEKLQEFREIRPTTDKKYCQYDDQGNLIGARHYDAIQFFVGYDTNRPAALVEVKSAAIELFEDEAGELITYVENNEEYVQAKVIYDLGKIIETQNV